MSSTNDALLKLVFAKPEKESKIPPKTEKKKSESKMIIIKTKDSK